MQIREMTIDDYEDAYRLWQSTPGIGLRSLDDSMDGITKFLDRNPRTCFVAVNQGTIIGTIMSGHDGRRGFIYHTAVASSYQRNGIGSALVEAALEALKSQGIHKVALVAFRSNEAGNRFWESEGFTDRTDLVYRDKALVKDG